MGCGPSANALFELKKNYTSETWFKTELMDLSDNSLQTYIITESTNFINVGHGMCSGPFKFGKSSTYQVRLTPMLCNGILLQDDGWSHIANPYKKELEQTLQDGEWKSIKNPYQENDTGFKLIYFLIFALSGFLLFLFFFKSKQK